MNSILCYENVINLTRLEIVSLELVDEIRLISVFLFDLHISPSRRIYVKTGKGCDDDRRCGSSYKKKKSHKNVIGYSYNVEIEIFYDDYRIDVLA